jgi:hypothetical protein
MIAIDMKILKIPRICDFFFFECEMRYVDAKNIFTAIKIAKKEL